MSRELGEQRGRIFEQYSQHCMHMLECTLFLWVEGSVCGVAPCASELPYRVIWCDTDMGWAYPTMKSGFFVGLCGSSDNVVYDAVIVCSE